MRIHYHDPIFGIINLLTKLGVADVVHYISYPLGWVHTVDFDTEHYVEAHFECR